MNSCTGRRVFHPLFWSQNLLNSEEKERLAVQTPAPVSPSRIQQHHLGSWEKPLRGMQHNRRYPVLERQLHLETAVSQLQPSQTLFVQYLCTAQMLKGGEWWELGHPHPSTSDVTTTGFPWQCQHLSSKPVATNLTTAIPFQATVCDDVHCSGENFH